MTKPSMKQQLERLKHENAVLKKALGDVLWMARRYADNSGTYAPSDYNQAMTSLLDENAISQSTLQRIMDNRVKPTDTVWARDRDFEYRSAPLHKYNHDGTPKDMPF